MANIYQNMSTIPCGMCMTAMVDPAMKSPNKLFRIEYAFVILTNGKNPSKPLTRQGVDGRHFRQVFRILVDIDGRGGSYSYSLLNTERVIPGRSPGMTFIVAEAAADVFVTGNKDSSAPASNGESTVCAFSSTDLRSSISSANEVSLFMARLWKCRILVQFNFS